MLYAVFYNNTFTSKREEHALQHELSQRLLSLALRKEYGLSLSELTIAKNSHGKPYFENSAVKFSVSHCSGLVCCAVSEFDIGIDCEKIFCYSERLARKICTEKELALLASAPDRAEQLTKLWTLKESLMKFSGKGMAYGFKNAEFTDESGFSGGIGAVSYKLAESYMLSVCTKGSLLPRPVLTDYSQLF